MKLSIDDLNDIRYQVKSTNTRINSLVCIQVWNQIWNQVYIQIFVQINQSDVQVRDQIYETN